MTSKALTTYQEDDHREDLVVLHDKDADVNFFRVLLQGRLYLGTERWKCETKWNRAKMNLRKKDWLY
jgi:hypothetical protein